MGGAAKASRRFLLPLPTFKEKIMAKKENTEISREERVTGKPPVEASEDNVSKDSREYRATHGEEKK